MDNNNSNKLKDNNDHIKLRLRYTLEMSDHRPAVGDSYYDYCDYDQGYCSGSECIYKCTEEEEDYLDVPDKFKDFELNTELPLDDDIWTPYIERLKDDYRSCFTGSNYCSIDYDCVLNDLGKHDCRVTLVSAIIYNVLDEQDD